MSGDRFPTRAAVASAALAVLAVAPGLGCGDDSVAEAPTIGTVGHVGELPGPFEVPGVSGLGRGGATGGAGVPDAGGSGDTAVETTDAAPTTEATPAPTDDDAPASDRRVGAFGERAAGNRILALGDSITFAIGPDHGGQLCDDLGRRGWEIGVDAEQGRDIAAGRAALERRLTAGEDWDAAVVNLGSNYRGDPAAFERDLRGILNALRPRPVIVVTVTEHDENIAEVNYVIRDLTRDREGVWVVEWSERTRTDDGLTGGDGLHLSERGRDVLSVLIAGRAGRAPEPDGFGRGSGCVALDDAGFDDAGFDDGRPSDTDDAADGAG